MAQIDYSSKGQPGYPPHRVWSQYGSVRGAHERGDAVTLHAASIGRCSGAPVLLVHGAGHTLHTFDNIAPALSKACGVFAYDLRGHGRSQHNSTETYLHTQYVADMADVIRAWCNAAPTVVASSISSLHALQLAAQEPDLVRAVVLIDILPEVRERTINGLRKFFRMNDFSSFRDLVEKYKFLSDGLRTSEDIAEELVHATTLDSEGRCRFNFDQRVIDIVGTEFLKEFDAAVPHVRCPVKLIRGGKSRVVSDDAVLRFRDNLRRDTIFKEVIIPRGGHCPWREDADRFVAEVQQFLHFLG